MKVAAYQAPLLPINSMDAIGLIAEQVRTCESAGAEILCCPEAVLGGLADYSSRPADIAIHVESGRLQAALRPIASTTVTTIVGFTESGPNGQIFNSAAVFSRGGVVGVYRKMHPAINRSVYEPGTATPNFKVDNLVFGIVICRDSTYLRADVAGEVDGLKSFGSSSIVDRNGFTCRAAKQLEPDLLVAEIQLATV